MSENNINLEANDQPSEATTYGGLLRIARENKDLSIDQVSSQLRISPDQIEGLESDNYKVFPTPVYARAHLRSYARLLGVDESKIISLFNAALAPDDKDPRTFIRRTTQELAPYHDAQPRNFVGKFIAGLLFLAVVIALGWIGYNYYMSQKAEKAIEEPQAAVSQPASAGPAEELAKTPEAAPVLVSETTAGPALQPAAEAPASEAQSQSERDAALKEKLQKEAEAAAAAKVAEEKRLAEEAKKTAAASTAAAEVPPKLLTLTHNDAEGRWDLIVPKSANSTYKVTIGAEGGECWFGVYQDKKLVHNAQLKSGETRDYEVPYPFKVSVGNREKGFVKVDGAPVDLNINNRATSTVFTLVQK